MPYDAGVRVWGVVSSREDCSHFDQESKENASERTEDDSEERTLLVVVRAIDRFLYLGCSPVVVLL